jgi:hypothetical protein
MVDMATVERELGVSLSFAWRLHKLGHLPVTYLGEEGKRGVARVRSADLVRLIQERSKNPKVRQSPRMTGESRDDD